MKTILLLRHAKSAWNDTRLSDHERPLNRRGERAARTIADHLAQNGPRPDLILCSTATRARQTLVPLIKRLGTPPPPLSLEDALYLASEGNLLARLQALADDVATVLLVAHNDGIWQLAEALAGRGPAAPLAALREKYPTGTLAVLQTPAGNWRDLAAGSGELVAFVRPRDLTRRRG
ncbi:histidine phosphatase family protein [Reyranella sp.]|uniref:SixA phosphatase family protein n=1 Tax=Reyranella sp. TaxID=1929291 RepID=UPI0027304A0F|nr:histidine phosphatase family protein [Reyranella sp.]MDP2372438.1 histidine phosphatase family protein [Reyranella sp.]